MSTSVRASRKRGGEQFKEEDDDYTGTDNTLNEPLHCRSTKKPCFQDRTTAMPAAAADSYFLANLDVAATVFAFLDIKSLLQVTLTSKTCITLLNHEHVVRSALMQGGHAKQSIERLVPLVEQRCIWVPSPLRMLRLVNGKRCECCNIGKANLISDSFGVFFCWNGCIQDNFTKGVRRNKTWTPYLQQPRIAKALYSSAGYLWTRPYTDTAGEQCGPLISKIEIEEQARGNKPTVSELLKRKDAMDVHAKNVPKILKVFQETKEAAENRAKETQQKKRQATNNTNERRKKNILRMIDALSEELGEVPWKDAALSYSWIKCKQKELVEFDIGFIDECMHEFVRAPSKASKKKLREVAHVLRGHFKMLEEKQLHDCSFLSRSDPMERLLWEYCSQQYSDYELLKSSWMDSSRLERIQSSDGGSMLDVLETLMPPFGRVLTPFVVRSSLGDVHDESMHKKAVSLALLLWNTERPNRAVTVKECFKVCIEKFPRLYKNTLDFVGAPETNAWKMLHGDGFAFPEAATDNLINEVWGGHPDAVALLLKRDYNAVLEVIWDSFLASQWR